MQHKHTNLTGFFNESYWPIGNTIVQHLPLTDQLTVSSVNQKLYSIANTNTINRNHIHAQILLVNITTTEPQLDKDNDIADIADTEVYQPPINLLNNINNLKKYLEQDPKICHSLRDEYAKLSNAAKLKFKENIKIWQKEIKTTLLFQKHKKFTDLPPIGYSLVGSVPASPLATLLVALCTGISFAPAVLIGALSIILPVTAISVGRTIAKQQNIADTERALASINYLKYLVDCVLETSPEAVQEQKDRTTIIRLLANINTNSTGINIIKKFVEQNSEISGSTIFEFMQEALRKRHNNERNLISLFCKPRHLLVSNIYNLFSNEISWTNAGDRTKIITALSALTVVNVIVDDKTKPTLVNSNS